MQNSVTLHKTPFHTLSDDLKAFILEFLTLADLQSLQLVSKDFYSFLKRTPRLWAIQLFLLFLDYVPEDDGLWEPPLYNEKLKIDEDSVSFSSMSKESKSLLKSHFILKKQYQRFFNRFLLTQQTDELIKEIFNIFRRPPYPMPCLKRDIHIFPTDTLFQNFLTEVHFGLHSRCSLTDRKQLMMEGLVEKIRTSPSPRSFDIAKLVLLRWYSMGSNEIFGRDFAPEPLHNVDQTFNFQEDFEMVNTQKSLTPKPLARKGRQDLKLIEEFYSLVNDLLVNHCKAVSTYLKAIKMDADVLNEYMRFWNGFVMATIGLNKALLPFSQYINRLYNETCPNLPKSPEFSTWRMMIKVWLDQIFAPVSDRLFNACRRVMTSIRNLNGLDELFKGVTNQDLEGNVFLGLPCNTEQSIKLLRRFNLAMCDLSYDESSIFFQECTCTLAGTPKGQLNEAIILDTNKIYDCAGELLFVKPENVQFFFKKDIETTETIFGRELTLKIREKQVSVLKDSLTGYLDTVSKGLDLSPKEDYIPSSSHTRAFNSVNIDGLNIAGMISVLRPEENQAQKIRLEKKIREDLVKKMGNKPMHLNSFFHLMTDLTGVLEKQRREREEAMRAIIVERGMEPMEERHQCFFTLNRNPLHNAMVIKELKEQREQKA